MSEPHEAPVALGRYLRFEAFASGGMATVHFGLLLGPSGFTRPVAIKRLKSGEPTDVEAARLFREEANLAARIRHPNVVVPFDVVAEGGALHLVMDYVDGPALSQLLEAQAGPVLPNLAAAVLLDVLQGLAAAHRAKDELGRPLGVVHRDVSPQNILAGADGVARLVDFGIAQAASAPGPAFGKLGYLSPEQLRGAPIDARADLWAVAVVAWELFFGRRLFALAEPEAQVAAILRGPIPWPSRLAPGLTAWLERGLARRPEDRFPDARSMAEALDRAIRRDTPARLQALVEAHAPRLIGARRARLASIEADPTWRQRTPLALEAPGQEPTTVVPALANKDPVLRSQSTQTFASEAQRLGERRFLEEFGLRIEAPIPELRWPLSKVHAFTGGLAEVLGDPALGLRLGARVPRGVYGLFEYVVRSARTLGEACERIVRYQRLTDPHVRFGFEPKGPGPFLSHGVRGHRLALGPQANEFVVSILVRIFREATQREVFLERITFAHPAPVDTSGHEHFFRVPVAFGAGENRLTFRPEALSTPFVVPDAQLAAVLLAEADAKVSGLPGPPEAPDPWLVEVRDALLLTLADGPPRLDRLAARLGLEPAGLRDALAARGLAFRGFADETRRLRALELLAAPGASTPAVAFLLGYADRRQLLRAYRRWTGRALPGRGPSPAR